MPELILESLSVLDVDQAGLAKLLHRGQPTVSRWLSGEAKPDYESCLRLAQITGMSATAVLETVGLAPRLIPLNPTATQPDPKRASRQQQVEEWFSAVGPMYEQYLWDHLKVQADSAVALLSHLRTAVSGATAAAVSDVPGGRAKRGRRSRNGGEGPLSVPQRATNGVLDTWLPAAHRSLASAMQRHGGLTAASAPA